MAKKNFKSGLDNLFKENQEEINQISQKKEEKNISTNIDLNDISDEKLKWLLIKIKRYEKELKLWRTGELNTDNFEKSLKNHNLTYDSETNQIIPK
ncbi:MAG: hypothetical protein JXR68_00685 [Bacteroidales bacterium]|nr:hypothetical protein [Bacteroidales bacterium]